MMDKKSQEFLKMLRTQVMEKIEVEAVEEFKKILVKMVNVQDNQMFFNDVEIKEFVKTDLNNLTVMRDIGFEMGYIKGFIDGKNQIPRSVN